MVFQCDFCDFSYPVKKSLLNHKRLKHGNPKQFPCQHCVYTTTKRENLKQHVKSQHEKVKEICKTCNKTFSEKSNLNKHIKNFHPDKVQGTKRKAIEAIPTSSKKFRGEAPEVLKCGVCLKEFRELFNLNKHVKNVHDEKELKCENCNYTTNNAPNMQRHVEKCKKRQEQDAPYKEEVHSCNQGPDEDTPSDEVVSCFGGTLSNKVWKQRGSVDILIVMQKEKEKIRNACWYQLKKHKGLQFYITIQTTMFKTDKDGQILTRKPFFCGKNRRMLDIHEFDDLYDQSKDKIWLSFDKWVKEGSGWRIKSVDKLILKMCEYKPINGSSFIKSPKRIVNSHSVVNVQNQDNKCFIWSVLAKLHPAEKHTERLSNYEKHEKELKTDGISWPMKLDKISKFENMNEMTVNVYMTDTKGRDIWPVYISKRRGSDPVNLLLLQDGEKTHFTWIKNFNRLLSFGDTNAKIFCPLPWF